jgi:hypothetical protein
VTITAGRARRRVYTCGLSNHRDGWSHPTFRGGSAAGPRLFGRREGRGLCRGETRSGMVRGAGAIEEFRVLRAPRLRSVGEGEVAEIIRGDVAVLDQLIGLGRRGRTSITSKRPISELKIALSFAPNALSRPRAVAFIRSSASQPN